MEKAEIEQLVQLNNTITNIHQTVLEIKANIKNVHDPKLFCYLEDKSYSEGAVVESRECKRRPIINIKGPDSQPLTWQKSLEGNFK